MKYQKTNLECLIDLGVSREFLMSTIADNEPARLELSLTKKEKADLIKNAKKMYALKPSALIRMLLKEKGVI
jgi:hypothetical protein